jgi:[acyl-carrier-protein] S-malonyltransferase
VSREQVAAWVDGEPVPAAEVTAEVARLRAGPLAVRLPRDGTADGRQLRRWVAQRVVLRRLLDLEAVARGLAGDHPLEPDAAVLGSAAADVLATSASARVVFASVTAGVTVGEEDVRAHHAAHPDRYARPERWLVRQVLLPDAPVPPAGELASALARAVAVETDPRTLLPELRAALPPAVVAPSPVAGIHSALAAPATPAGRVAGVVGPVRSRHGWVLLAVDAVLPAGPVPYAEVRAEIESRLLGRARQAAFARWLDGEAAARIRLGTGFEHPADPRQPDATHRH